MASLEALKKQAALRAVAHVKSGMHVGLGTGSTAKYATEAIGERLQRGELEGISAVATSTASADLAQSYGITLRDLSGQRLDVAIDGMDELDPQLNAIKGLGGALTREKMVEVCADLLILIADDTKLVERLGEKARLPVEVVPFGWRSTESHLRALGLTPERRHDSGEPFITDNGNYILDCRLPQKDVHKLAERISVTPGVLEHGFFLDMAGLAYVASATEVTEYKRGTS